MVSIFVFMDFVVAGVENFSTCRRFMLAWCFFRLVVLTSVMLSPSIVYILPCCQAESKISSLARYSCAVVVEFEYIVISLATL